MFFYNNQFLCFFLIFNFFIITYFRVKRNLNVSDPHFILDNYDKIIFFYIIQI